MIYLASPYTHHDHIIMEQRFHAACRAAGALMAQGKVVFSPIAHTHPIAVRCELPRGWDFWQRLDEEFIRLSDEVVVLMLDGWQESKGIRAEIAIARELQKPLTYLHPVNVKVAEAAEKE